MESVGYEEILEGTLFSRSAPGERHEKICARLHEKMAAGINGLVGTKLLAPRTGLKLNPHTRLCPDLVLVTSANDRLVLAVEIISRDDHKTDTVTKKDIYQQIRVPRLWIVDPRYDNVEIYHTNQWGLSLQGILAGQEILADELWPEFAVKIKDLFSED